MSVGYIPKGYYIKIEARSGNGFKKHLYPHFGIIDNGYRGDLGVKMYNHSNEDQLIEKGKGVAQFSIHKMEQFNIEFMDDNDVVETERNIKGFGSSDE